jgi:hypothetical protein
VELSTSPQKSQPSGDLIHLTWPSDDQLLSLWNPRVRPPSPSLSLLSSPLPIWSSAAGSPLLPPSPPLLVGSPLLPPPPPLLAGSPLLLPPPPLRGGPRWPDPGLVVARQGKVRPLVLVPRWVICLLSCFWFSF